MDREGHVSMSGNGSLLILLMIHRYYLLPYSVQIMVLPQKHSLVKAPRISFVSFPDDLVDSVVLHTNLYAMQKGFAITFTRKDILGYIGLNITSHHHGDS